MTLVVSSGKAKAAVPGVVGKSFDEARSTLEAAGFRVTRTDQESATSPPTRCWRRAPAAPQVDEGSTVSLTVAKEPAQVDVTDVTARARPTAIRRLSKDGFEVDQKTSDVDYARGRRHGALAGPGGRQGEEGLDGDDHGRQVRRAHGHDPETTTTGPGRTPAPGTP